MTFEATKADDLDIEAWVQEMKATHGYAQIAVHDPDTKLPGYAFTIGLENSRSVSELLCLGVAPDISSQLFKLFTDAHDAGVLDLSLETQDITNLVPDHTLRLRRVPAAMVALANSAKPQSHGEISALVQVLLPDNDGHFPGEAACDPQVAAAQDVDWLLAPVPN